MKSRLLLALALLGAAGCEPATYSHWQEYGIHVAEIEHPDTVALGQPFTVRFFGEIGPTTCHRFLQFVQEATPAQLEVALVGRLEIGGQTQCNETPRMLGPDATITVSNAASGEYRIIVYQPDNTTLEGTVVVE